MPFSYFRTVRFSDTDAAGVVYFARILSMCHEAYEASLATAEIDLKQFFRHSDWAIPIVHTSADFHRPLCCGDLLAIVLNACALSEWRFETRYQFFAAKTGSAKTELEKTDLLASAIAIHVCIDPERRIKQPLPAEMQRWLQLVQQD